MNGIIGSTFTGKRKERRKEEEEEEEIDEDERRTRADHEGAHREPRSPFEIFVALARVRELPFTLLFSLSLFFFYGVGMFSLMALDAVAYFGFQGRAKSYAYSLHIEKKEERMETAARWQPNKPARS